VQVNAIGLQITNLRYSPADAGCYAFGLTSTIADPEPPATFQNHVAQEELKLLWLQLGRTNPTPTESLNDQTEKLGTEK